jgi:glycosyl hydrolase family 2
VGTFAAAESSDTQSLETDSADIFDLFNGRALVIVRASRKDGEITLKADADGLHSSSIVIQSKPKHPSPKLR